MIVFLILAALFVALACLFFAGKGGTLLAGYNTASEAERAKYDEKKLFRVAGVGLLVIAAALAALGLWPLWFGSMKGAIWVFLAVVLSDVILMVILSNTVCKK